jgi:hypothetical protein
VTLPFATLDGAALARGTVLVDGAASADVVESEGTVALASDAVGE